MTAPVRSIGSRRVCDNEAIADLRKLADDLESGKAVAFGIIKISLGDDVRVKFSGLESASDALRMIGGIEHLKADIMRSQGR